MAFAPNSDKSVRRRKTVPQQLTTLPTITGGSPLFGGHGTKPKAKLRKLAGTKKRRVSGR